MATHSGIPILVFKGFIMSVCKGLQEAEADILSQEVDADMDGFINKQEFTYIFTEYNKKNEESKKWRMDFNFDLLFLKKIMQLFNLMTTFLLV